MRFLPWLPAAVTARVHFSDKGLEFNTTAWRDASRHFWTNLAQLTQSILLTDHSVDFSELGHTLQDYVLTLGPAPRILIAAITGRDPIASVDSSVSSSSGSIPLLSGILGTSSGIGSPFSLAPGNMPTPGYYNPALDNGVSDRAPYTPGAGNTAGLSLFGIDLGSNGNNQGYTGIDPGFGGPLAPPPLLGGTWVNGQQKSIYRYYPGFGYLAPSTVADYKLRGFISPVDPGFDGPDTNTDGSLDQDEVTQALITAAYGANGLNYIGRQQLVPRIQLRNPRAISRNYQATDGQNFQPFLNMEGVSKDFSRSRPEWCLRRKGGC